jgi:hypothetical protein
VQALALALALVQALALALVQALAPLQHLVLL